MKIKLFALTLVLALFIPSAFGQLAAPFRKRPGS